MKLIRLAINAYQLHACTRCPVLDVFQGEKFYSITQAELKLVNWLSLSVYSRCCIRICSAMIGVNHRPLLPSLPTSILYEKVIKSKLFDDVVHYTSCSLLAILNISCNKLHCQNMFNVIPFSDKIVFWRRFSTSAGSTPWKFSSWHAECAVKILEEKSFNLKYPGNEDHNTAWSALEIVNSKLHCQKILNWNSLPTKSFSCSVPKHPGSPDRWAQIVRNRGRTHLVSSSPLGQDTSLEPSLDAWSEYSDGIEPLW